MHPYVLIPFASAIGAAVLASAIAAREPDRRANRLMSAMLACIGVWSLCELLWTMAPSAELATLYIRWSSLGSLMLGALVMHMLVTGSDELARYRVALPLAYALCIVAVVIGIGTDLAVVDAKRTRFGWQPVPGRGLALVYVLVTACPLVVLADWLARRIRDPGPLIQGRISRVVWAGAACFFIATLTDVVLPMLGFSAPRLGSATAVAWGGVTWWAIYRFRQPRLSLQKFAGEILETLPDGIALVRLDGRIRTSNEQLGELAELPPEALPGMPLCELLAGLHSGGNDSERECELVTGTGHRIPVSVSTAPLTDEEGNAIGQVFVVRDLREVVSLRSRLVASGRLVAVGQLAAGIAHEINNPISYVRSNLRLLDDYWGRVVERLGKTPAGPPLRDAFREGPDLLLETSQGIDRVANIVRDVSGFSRGRAVGQELASVGDLLDTALRVAVPQLKSLEIERHCEEMPPVSCVPQELIQVFLNVILNAAQACGGRGVLRLSTRLEGATAVVEIADDGPGMTSEVRARIFEPFFTTKPVGKGTGLGLAISSQIVSKHKGAIEVESEPGHGTAFRIRLPVRSQRAATAVS